MSRLCRVKSFLANNLCQAESIIRTTRVFRKLFASVKFPNSFVIILVKEVNYGSSLLPPQALHQSHNVAVRVFYKDTTTQNAQGLHLMVVGLPVTHD